MASNKSGRLESTRSQVDNRRFKWSSQTLWGYGVGHFQSDLVATMWFSYLLVVLEQIVGLPKVNAGILLSIGQLTDGIATPLVGLGLDKLGLCGAKYSKRKSWHLMGTLLITISFPFIYSPPPGYDPDLENWTGTQLMFYYIPFIVLFQIAWASAQVSHLSLIPCLTCKDSARVQLTSLRNAFTLLASIAVYVTTYGLLMTSRDSSEIEQLNKTVLDPDHVQEVIDQLSPNCTMKTEPVDQVSWEDRSVYQRLSLGAVAIGFIFQGLIFHFTVHEPTNECLTEDAEACPALESKENPTSTDPSIILGSKLSLNVPLEKGYYEEILVNVWYEWFKCPLFYIVAGQYCLTRLIVNITASYMPFYLQESLDLPKEYIAIVPLVQFIIGFLVSFLMKPLTKYIGKNGTYFLGCLMCIAGAICATLLEADQKFRLFLLPVFFGAGCATILVQSLAITAALIGENTSTAAFVYGAMSLTDKIACGGAIMLVQVMSPCNDEMVPNGPCEENGCGLYYCRLLGYGIAALSLFAIINNVFHWSKTKNSSDNAKL